MSTASTDTMKTLNFLLQAAAQEAGERPVLGSMCGSTMKRISMKNVVRTTRAVKDTMCKACGALLFLPTKKEKKNEERERGGNDGEMNTNITATAPSSVSLRVRGGCAIVACKQCGHCKRCPLPKRKPKNLGKGKKKPKYKHKMKQQKSSKQHEL